jgi:hypothetical protein
MQTTLSPVLAVLLDRFFDYAGLFPPAALHLAKTIENYDAYSHGEYSWMLRHLVIPAKDVANVPASFSGSLSVLSEQDEPRAQAIESKNIVSSGLPVYCEVASGDTGQLDAIKAAGCFAKLRTGGLTPQAIPSPSVVAAFIRDCAERKLPFKLTAGLHHPIRAEQALTYEPNSPRSTMHGFLNVVFAAAFAWKGHQDLEEIVAEKDASAFNFADGLSWRGKTLSVEEVRDARWNFIHSIGSCSFEEPVQDLKTLRLL